MFHKSKDHFQIVFYLNKYIHSFDYKLKNAEIKVMRPSIGKPLKSAYIVNKYLLLVAYNKYKQINNINKNWNTGSLSVYNYKFEELIVENSNQDKCIRPPPAPYFKSLVMFI